MWSLWKHRNLKLWEDVNETDGQVIDRAFHLIEDWSTANATIQSQAPLSAPARWGSAHSFWHGFVFFVNHGMATSVTGKIEVQCRRFLL
jgi:hypothetical protein